MQSEDFDLARFLPYQLAVLSERVSKALSTVYTAQHDLSVADWRVLVHAARGGAISVREIHRTVNLEKPRVSRSVAKLVNLGLLAKQVDTSDKRLVEISLTEHGSQILDEILAKALAFERNLISALSQRDLEQMQDISDRLHRRLDSIHGGPNGGMSGPEARDGRNDPVIGVHPASASSGNESI